MKTVLDSAGLVSSSAPIDAASSSAENLASCLSLSDKFIARSRLDEYHLSYEEGYSILSALPSQPQFSESDLWNQRESCAQTVQQTASLELLSALEKLKNNEINALVLRNFPVDIKLPPTPTNGFIGVNSVLKPLEFLLGIFESMQVFPVGYAGENNDQFIRHVVPSERALTETSSHGSLEPLKCHIDNGHMPIGNESSKSHCPAPNYIIWMGLRCDIKVPTTVVLLEDILLALPPDVALLRES